MEKYDVKSIVEHWLNEKIHKPLVCEVCAHSSWGLERDTMTPIVMEGNRLLLGNKSFPQIVLVCQHCGNIKYFSAIKLGILEDNKDTKGKDDGSKS